MFKGISLSLKGALWTAAGIIIVAAGVYAAWQLTDDDAEKEEQGVETTGQTVSEPEQVGTDQQEEEDSEGPTTTTTTAPVEDQQEEEDSEGPATATTVAPVEDQQEEEDSEGPATATTVAPAEDQQVEDDAEEAPATATTAAPAEDQQVEDDAEEPLGTRSPEEGPEEPPTTTTTVPVEEPTTTTTTAPVEDQQEEEDPEVPTTTTTVPVEEPTTTTTAAPVEDQQEEEDIEVPTTTTTAAPENLGPLPPNSDFWEEVMRIHDFTTACGWYEDEYKQCHNHPEDTQIAIRDLGNQHNCEWDVTWGMCVGQTFAEFEFLTAQLACFEYGEEWYFDIFIPACYHLDHPREGEWVSGRWTDF